MAATIDAAEFADWARPSLPAMTRLARRLAPRADADDIVQDALARAWVKRGQFDADRGTPTTWLLAIVADQARAARRSRVRRLRVVDDFAEVPDNAAPDPGIDLDLERAISQLPERQQLAVHLHYFVGLSIDETAAVMSCSPGTVKSTLYDARTRLRPSWETPMTDERMDARLRRAGEVWRTAVAAAPQAQAVLDIEPLTVAASAKPTRRRRRVGLLASAALVVAALIAGGAVLIANLAGKSTPQASTASLTNTHWSLLRYVSGSGQENAVFGDVTLLIDDKHHLSGSDGCNSLSGDVQVTGSVIYIGSLEVTERACTDDRLMASSVLIDTELHGDLRWSIKGDELTLSNMQSGDSLVYRAGTSPTRSTDPRDLGGVTWQLSTIETATSQNGTAHTVTGIQTLRVGTRLEFTAGCNFDGADVVVGHGTMQIGSSGGTAVLCTGALADEERAIGAVLSGRVDWVIEGDQLTITKGGVGTLVYNRGAAPTDVLGKTWTLSSIAPDGLTGQFRLAPYSLTMSAHEVRLRTPCHDYQGRFTFQGSTVAFSGVHDVGGNECRTPAIPSLVQLLDGTPQWSLQNGRLTLSAGDTVANFVSDATPFSSLLGRKWTLTGWQSPSGNAIMRTDQPTGATSEVSFDAAGDVTIKHRCYVNKGSARIGEGTLGISGVRLASALPCPAKHNQQAEQASDSLVDSVLTGGSTWSINGAELVIAKGDVTLTFTG